MSEAANNQTGDLSSAEPEPDSRQLRVDIDLRDAAWQGHQDDLRAQAILVWSHLALPSAEVSLVLTDSAFIAELNETYRDKKGATNVLSFPAQDFTAPVSADALAALPAPRLLGDIVLAHDVVLAEADAQGKNPDDHMHHLLIHGLLHLLGHDHVAPQAAAQMEALEISLLAAQGRPNPYLTEQAI